MLNMVHDSCSLTEAKYSYKCKQTLEKKIKNYAGQYL